CTICTNFSRATISSGFWTSFAQRSMDTTFTHTVFSRSWMKKTIASFMYVRVLMLHNVNSNSKLSRFQSKMPDKSFGRRRKCEGNHCLRCWRNHLKHANPQVKAYMKKHSIKSFD